MLPLLDLPRQRRREKVQRQHDQLMVAPPADRTGRDGRALHCRERRPDLRHGLESLRRIFLEASADGKPHEFRQVRTELADVAWLALEYSRHAIDVSVAVEWVDA